MAKKASKEQNPKLLSTRQVIKLVPGLNRDLLYFWVQRKRWLGDPPNAGKPRKGRRRKHRRYTKEEVEKIRLLLRSYQAGYTAEAVGSSLGGSSLLADPKLYERAIRAITQITSTVPLHDLEKTLQTAASCLGGVIEVEEARVFLIERDATDSDGWKLVPGSRVNKGTFTPASSWAYDAISQLRSIQPDPIEFESKSSFATEDLRSSTTSPNYSLLAVPMLTRRKGPIGVIEFRNRQSGQQPIPTYFDAQDRTMCEVLADHLTQCVQAVRIFETQRDIIERLDRGDAHLEVLDWLLSRILLILPAERADIALRAIDSSDVIVHAKRGPGEIKLNGKLPTESLGYLMCNDRRPTKTVEQATETHEGYVRFWQKARSIISVKFRFPFPAPGRFGAITAESSRPDAFDTEFHGDVLERITSSIALGDSFLRQGFDSRLELATQLIEDVLEGIKQGPGMDAAIVYQVVPFPWDSLREPNKTHRLKPIGELQCVAAAGSWLPPDFRYQLDRPSFAQKIAETAQPQFSAIPREDPSVCPKGLDLFDIRGPIIGAPIVHRGVVVGALVCWSREAKPPVEADKDQLVPYAKILASSLFMSQSAAKYTSRRLLDVKKVLLQMQAEPSKDGVLKVILEALVLAGFDRARAFHYAVDNHAFEPLECAGMQDRQKFFSAPIDIHRSFYANQTFSDWSQTKEAKRIYPDVGHLDPYENQLDKVAGWPWAQTPLVIHGKLYGYLAADNHIGRHPITQDMLDFLTVMGVLTAQAIQNEITHIVDK